MDKKIKYDLVVYGATGFTGRLVVDYIIREYGIINKEFTWAIAGRNKDTLTNLRNSYKVSDSKSKDIPIIIADSYNSKSLDQMTSICNIVITTAGPYLKYGLPLVESCVKNNTHYCDLTGEVPFIRESIDLYDSLAKKNKCKIIHSCGFDSIPSDIGVLLLQLESIEKDSKPCDLVQLYSSMKGGFSGGTIESMIQISAYINSNPHLRPILNSPYSLNPKEKLLNNTHQKNLKKVKWNEDVQCWTSPFIMSGVNTRIVRRTNALLNSQYGDNFKYSEVSSFRKGLKGFLKAWILLMGLAIIQLSLSFAPLLFILKTFYFPKPGQGPSKEIQEKGFFKMKIIGTMDNHKEHRVTVLGDSDPGYSATAKMITESALSVLLNKDKIPNNFGILTPASAIGIILADRLSDKGIKFSIDDQKK